MNKLNRKLIIGVCFLFTSEAFAQDIEVKKFEPMTMDQTAALSPRKDINGKDCALVLVHTLKTGIEFEGWVVGNVDYKDDTYWVYMANGAKHLKMKHPNYQTKDVIFNDYGINSLEGAQYYSLYLIDEATDIINKAYSKGWNLGDMEVPDNAKTFLNMAAKRGDVRAMKVLAQLSLEGNVKIELGEVNHKGIYWIKRLLAAGDSTCLDQMPGELMYAFSFQLWDDYRRSGELSKNEKDVYTKVCEYIIKACIKGFSQAGNKLFEDYLMSNGLPDYSKDVIRCCEDSSKNGSISAIKCLATIYEKGIGEKIDLNKAEKWYRLLYERVPTQCDGLCRIYGNKLYPINEENLSFIRNRANEGNEEAMFQLGYMYEEGRNVQRDLEKAQDFYSKCYIHIGAIYRSALLFCKSTEYEKAIRKGELLMMRELPSSMNLICLRDILGYHGAKSGYPFFYNINREKAVLELKELAKKGHEDAIAFLKHIGL